MNRYDPEAVKVLCAAIAQAAGVAAEDALILADSLVEADISGTSTHGVTRLHIYVRRIQKGLVDPRAQLRIERERGAVLACDAANGLGQVQTMKVLWRLLPMARASGVASATMRRSQHSGALSYFCNKAASEGMALLATTNAEPAIAPEGGSQAYFGTNPIAVSFPTGKGYPVKIDLATSLVARGNIIAADKKGEPIPAGWALDPAGNPTTDAAQALLGSVLAMAGHKGYALALMAEVFSGVLSGAAVGGSVGSMYKHMDRAQDVGQFFCLFDIEAFLPLQEFTHRIDAMIDEIKATRKRPGIEEILIPGERSSRTAARNRRAGITIGDETRRELQSLCEELAVPFTLQPKE